MSMTGSDNDVCDEVAAERAEDVESDRIVWLSFMTDERRRVRCEINLPPMMLKW